MNDRGDILTLHFEETKTLMKRDTSTDGKRKRKSKKLQKKRCKRNCKSSKRRKGGKRKDKRKFKKNKLKSKAHKTYKKSKSKQQERQTTDYSKCFPNIFKYTARLKKARNIQNQFKRINSSRSIISKKQGKMVRRHYLKKSINLFFRMTFLAPWIF